MSGFVPAVSSMTLSRRAAPDGPRLGTPLLTDTMGSRLHYRR